MDPPIKELVENQTIDWLCLLMSLTVLKEKSTFSYKQDKKLTGSSRLLND